MVVAAQPYQYPMVLTHFIAFPSSPFITIDIMDCCECICGTSFRNRGALAKHKQYCAEVLAEIRRTCSVLQSTSTIPPHQHNAISVLQSTSTIPPHQHNAINDVDDTGASDAHVYEFVDYEIDNDDNNNNLDAPNDNEDKEDDNYDYNDNDNDSDNDSDNDNDDDDDEDVNEYDLYDSIVEDYDSDDDNHSASISIAEPSSHHYHVNHDHHWMDFENDMSCDDSDYSFSSSSDESDVIPEFSPPLFSQRKIHLSAAYKLQVGLNNFWINTRQALQCMNS